MNNSILYGNLYNDSDIEEAIDFLSRIFIEKGSLFGQIKFDNIEIHEFYQNTIYNLIRMMYGKNVVTIANYMKVQEFVLNKVIEVINNYLYNSNIDFYICDFVPYNLYNILIIRKMKNILLGTDEALNSWNPEEKWDLENDNISINKYLMNPINGIVHAYLFIKRINIKMINDFYKYDIPFNRTSEGYIIIKLLPYNNFNKILNIVDIIFKYI